MLDTAEERAQWQRERAQILARTSGDFMSEEQRIAYRLIVQRWSGCSNACRLDFALGDAPDHLDALSQAVLVTHAPVSGSSSSRWAGRWFPHPGIDPRLADEMVRIGSSTGWHAAQDVEG